MKHRISFLVGLFALLTGLASAETITSAEAARRVAEGTAVLIDVREPREWRDGVAEPALLLSLSDLRGERTQWTSALKAHAGKQLILYCRSGNRSGIAAAILEKEGFVAPNAGSFKDWVAAELPTRKP